MCLEAFRLPRLSSPALARKQAGFLMPVAIFIVVIMGLFALMIWRTSVQTNRAAVQELLSTQAFYAAESGAQTGMNELFYPNASSKVAVDNQCANMGSLNLNFSGIEGLNLCSATVTCECSDENGAACEPSAGYSFYTLSSVGECGSGDLRAERSLRMSSYMKQE